MTACGISIESFARVVRSAMGALLSDGYAFSGAEARETQAIGPYLEAVLSSAKRGRKIRVSFLPAVPNAPECLAIIVQGNGDEFEIMKYLRHIGAAHESQLSFELSLQSGTVEERIASVLAASVELFKGSLEPVIFGRHWVDVPFEYR